jgi:FAD:protein FMN transferase
LPGVIARVEHIMGMPIFVEVRDGAAKRRAQPIDDMFTWLRWVDETFSTHKEHSEINRLARSELRLGEVDPLVRDVLARCEELRDETRGYFDVYATGGLDPSGLVKGWAVQRAAAMLETAGFKEFAVNAGGDIKAVGGPWRIGIQHPQQRGTILQVVEATDLAVATSAASAREDVVVDPHTRKPAAGVLSVTITGPDLATADAYTTAAFAMGEAGAAWAAKLEEYEALTLLTDGRVAATPRFPAEPDHEKRRVGGAFVHPTDRLFTSEDVSEPLGGAST